MRLINTESLELEDFFNADIPEYAILSHCWDANNEVSYQEYKNGSSSTKMTKIVNFCALAKNADLKYGWVDTCCIDKSSSTELTEAINSMYSWYGKAKICFAFLSDYHQQHRTSEITSLGDCRWFKRGWCLQELIAPRDLRFFDSKLELIGTKDNLAHELASITGIPKGCLVFDKEPKHYSVAQRMSWASKRTTTRIEDTAYCLLGIFDVDMPLLYGEGTRAFQRLQQAIISQSDDDSIFTWIAFKQQDKRGILAASPKEFATTGNIRPIYYERKPPPPAVTGRGLQIQYPYVNAAQKGKAELLETLFGTRSDATPETVILRLDCEVTDLYGVDYWVGVELCRNTMTGIWYRSNADTLLCSRQNPWFRRIYPSPWDFRTLYVDVSLPTVIPDSNKQHDPHVLGLWCDTMPKYTRPFWLSLLLIGAQITSMQSWVWVANAVHRVSGLDAPSSTVNSWAYLTFAWVIEGQRFTFLICLVIFGLLDKGRETYTYGYWDVLVAVFKMLPIQWIHHSIDALHWIDLCILWSEQMQQRSKSTGH